MTAPARITQMEADRAVKSLVAAGIARARIIHDLKNQRIEIIIGESPAAAPAVEAPKADTVADREAWSDEDV